MKFAHLADVHIGSWRDPVMKNLNLKAFKQAISQIIAKNMDFVLIAGDLFHTALPAIDYLQETVIQLKKLKNAGISVYVIPGSHDYSAGGSTILDVLEEADLLKNAMKFKVTEKGIALKYTQDKATGALITGLGGRKGGLERKDYSMLNKQSLVAEGFKIFMFHTTLKDLLPNDMSMIEGITTSELPQGFDYYAGGHIHIIRQQDNIIYPGPIFPASFSELWSLGKGGYYTYEEGEIKHNPIELKKVMRIEVNAEAKTPEEIEQELMLLTKKDFSETIVLIKVKGTLRTGKPSDINFKQIMQDIYNKNAYFVMRNTSKLSSKDFEQVQITSGTTEEVEQELIAQHTKELSDSMLTKEILERLMRVMSQEQRDGEKKYEYEERITKEIDSTLNI